MVFTQWFDGVFSGILWPIIGFIFLPTTLLWYTIVYNWYDNSWGIMQIALLIVALIIDLYPASGKRKKRWKGNKAYPNPSIKKISYYILFVTTSLSKSLIHALCF